MKREEFLKGEIFVFENTLLRFDPFIKNGCIMIFDPYTNKWIYHLEVIKITQIAYFSKNKKIMFNNLKRI